MPDDCPYLIPYWNELCERSGDALPEWHELTPEARTYFRGLLPREMYGETRGDWKGTAIRAILHSKINPALPDHQAEM